MAEQLEELKDAWAQFSNPESDCFAEVNLMVCAALDLKSTALSVDLTQLGAVAKSLHVLAETHENVSDPKVMALIGAHVQTLAAVHALESADKEGQAKAEQLVKELMVAVKAVGG